MEKTPDLSLKNPFARMLGVSVEQIRIGELIKTLRDRHSSSFTRSDILILPAYQIAFELGVENGEPVVCTSKNSPHFEPLRKGDLVIYSLPLQGKTTFNWAPFKTFSDVVERINSARLIRVLKHAKKDGSMITGLSVLTIMYLTDFLHLAEDVFQDYSNSALDYDFVHEFQISQYGSKWATIPNPRKEECAGVF